MSEDCRELLDNFPRERIEPLCAILRHNDLSLQLYAFRPFFCNETLDIDNHVFLKHTLSADAPVNVQRNKRPFIRHSSSVEGHRVAIREIPIWNTPRFLVELAKFHTRP